MNPAICTAISEKRVVRVFYGGGYRSVEPFCYGKDSIGKELLRAYQVSGYSRSGDIPGWRLLDAQRMGRLTVTDTKFAGRRPGYNPDDSGMATIYCRV